VPLTRAEFSLLQALAHQPGRVLSRDELSQAVGGRGAEPDDRSVDVLMSRLRRKIEPDPKTPRIIVTMPGEGYKFTAKPQAVVAPAPFVAAPSLTTAATPESTAALDQGAAASDAKAQGTEAREASVIRTADGARTASTTRALQIALAVAFVVVATVGWEAWSNRATLLHSTEVTPRIISPGLSSTPPQPGTSEEDRRATVFKRMVAVMQDDRFDWRTVERLAIDAGVNEGEAHEILAEHPGEVMLGKSRDGKLIARLAGR